MPAQSPKVRIVTLGCAKNEVDSEEIAGVLQRAGYDVDGSAERSALTVINTCGFLQSAKDESVRAIKTAVREKRAGRTDRVIVAGCLAQRMGPELRTLAPGADLYIGVGQMARFAEIARAVETAREAEVEVSAPHHRWAEVTTRARAGRPWSAYLKVSEGCDHRCTFCTIPSFRGPHASKPIERVVEEARYLARTGAIELNLIAQDVTQYGYDLYREFTLPRLLRELDAIDGIRWIRILYFYPNRLTDEVIETMASCQRVLPYIDIPLQHTHPEVLRRMHRPWDGERYLRVFEKVRAAMPQCAIRTTFIVGFPGETEEEFRHLLDFIDAARLDRVGAFAFSREPGTPAFDMSGQIPPRIRQDRYDRLMRRQQGISLEINESWIGREVEVLVEDVKDGWRVGRSHRDAPDIDGLVFLADEPGVSGDSGPGSIVRARITGAEHYDLYGEAIGRVGLGSRTLRPIKLAAGS